MKTLIIAFLLISNLSFAQSPSFTNELNELNLYREALGHPAITIDSTKDLSGAAAGLAKDYRHKGLHGAVAECISWRTPSQPSIMYIWLQSPKHRDILLAKGYKTCAIGYYSRGGEEYWILRFYK